MIQHLDDLVAKAKARGKRRLIVAYGQDSHTLEAVNDAVEAGIVDATLVGNPEEIEKVCKAEGIDMSRFTIVAENVDVNCASIRPRRIVLGNRQNCSILHRRILRFIGGCAFIRHQCCVFQ